MELWKLQLSCVAHAAQAFEDLIAGAPVTLDELLKDTASLSKVVLYHCQETAVPLGQIKGGAAKTLSNQNVKIKK